MFVFFFQAEDGIRDLVRSRGLGDVYKRQPSSSVYDFYAFDESLTDGYWLNQKVPANNMTHFIPGKGYLVAYESTAVKTFEAVSYTHLTLPTSDLV